MAQIALNSKGSPPASDWKKWIGVFPFFLFAILFLILPSLRLFIGSFTNADGQFTIANILQLFQEKFILDAYWLSIRISAATALGGGIFGFLLAYSVTVGGLPKPMRSALITFSGVASNFAGVPLAFAFIATLGRTGFVTALIKNLFGVNIYTQTDFDLYSFWGLSLTYMYFQFPLMVLIMVPALDGLKREWREAAENLGASTTQYWLRVALPVLLPSILGSMILLFGNAFGAYATAYA
ncbi:MAG: ABC transporter permease subunit, partial [Anaerolineales bacterium]|nr:ABC transporter permease subunit [Anaerolineales bacterium]